MVDQTRSGPEDGGGAMGDGSVPIERDVAEGPGLRQQAKDSVRDARDQLKAQVRERTDQAKQSAERVVDDRKGTLAETVTALAAAIDAAAASLDDGSQDRLAEWTRELSGRARRIATYLDDHDTRGLVTDLEGTAREHPTAFVGTSFAAGLAAGRFLRASERSNGVADMISMSAEGVEPALDVEPDPALRADAPNAGGASPEHISFRGGYGNPGSGYGTTGSSVGATRSGLGDAGFGPTQTGSSKRDPLGGAKRDPLGGADRDPTDREGGQS